MAYSGAISMCSGKTLYPNGGSSYSYILIGLALIVLFGVLLNRRGRRTTVATILVSIGITLLLLSQFILMSSSLYYLGAAIIFMGVWINGSFFYFWNRFTQFIDKISSLKFTKYDT